MFKTLLLIGSILLCLTAFVFAGTTGKIDGLVIDGETGNPLPGVNVIIQGTSLGAATNIDGKYVTKYLQDSIVTIFRRAMFARMVLYW